MAHVWRVEHKYSPSTVLVSGMELRSSGLPASAFTYGVLTLKDKLLLKSRPELEPSCLTLQVPALQTLALTFLLTCYFFGVCALSLPCEKQSGAKQAEKT